MKQHIHTGFDRLVQWTEQHTKIDARYIYKGGFWLWTGNVIGAVSVLILSVAFANLLPKETYGTYKFILATVSILSIPALGAMDSAMTQAIARGVEGSYIDAFKTKLRWSALGSGGAIALALYYFFNDNMLLAYSFLVSTPFIPIIFTYNIYRALLNGKKLFYQMTTYFFVSRLLAVSVLVATLFLTNNLFLILLAYFVPLALIRVILFFYTKKTYPLNDTKEPGTISRGKHLSLIGVVSTIAQHLDSLLLFHYLGAVEVAVYAFARAPVEQIAVFYKDLPKLAVPKLATAKRAKINSLLPRGILLITSVGIFTAALYYVVAPPLYDLLFPDYQESIFFSQLFAVILILQPLAVLLRSLAQSRLNITPKKWLYFRLIPRSAMVISLFVFVPIFGIIGAVLSHALSFVVAAITFGGMWLMLSKKEGRQD